MFALADRIFETSVTAGVGTYTLDGAQPGFQAFSVIGANNECTYFATDDTFWEVGIGKYLSAPNRLTRETILASSNGGAAVNWGGQTVKLRCSVPAAGITAKRRLSKSVAGGATVALTQDEQRRDILELTGALTADIDVTVDATVWAWSDVYNNTTGGFKVTFKVAGQTGVRLTQGMRMPLYCNGTDVARVAAGISAVPILNGKVTLTQDTPAANALRIALKTEAGNDPSALDPVWIAFRSATLTSSEWTYYPVTAALSTDISAGSTAGHAAGKDQHLFIYALLNGVTPELFWSNLPPDYPGTFLGKRLVTTTAEGGAGAADSATGVYSTTARAGVPWTSIAKAVVNNAVAGNWASAPVQVDLAPFDIPSCAFEAARAASQTISTSTWTKIAFDTENYDYDATFDLATNDRHQPNVAGLYEYEACTNWDNVSNNGNMRISFYKNGVEHKSLIWYTSINGAYDGNPLTIREPMNGTTDYMEVFVHQASGSDKGILNDAKSTFFSGSRRT